MQVYARVVKCFKHSFAACSRFRRDTYAPEDRAEDPVLQQIASFAFQLLTWLMQSSAGGLLLDSITFGSNTFGTSVFPSDCSNYM